jgi:hypothetical protein
MTPNAVKRRRFRSKREEVEIFFAAATESVLAAEVSARTSITIVQYQIFILCVSGYACKFARERMEYFGDRRDRRKPDAKWELAARVNL